MKKIPLTISRGKIIFNRKLFNDTLKELKQGFYNIEIHKKRSMKSQDQLGYYFNGLLVEQCWNYNLVPRGRTPTEEEIEVMDREMRIEYLWKDYYSSLSKKTYRVYGTISKLNTKQMAEYIERMKRGEAEKGYYLPDPEPDRLKRKSKHYDTT